MIPEVNRAAKSNRQTVAPVSTTGTRGDAPTFGNRGGATPVQKAIAKDRIQSKAGVPKRVPGKEQGSSPARGQTPSGTRPSTAGAVPTNSVGGRDRVQIKKPASQTTPHKGGVDAVRSATKSHDLNQRIAAARKKGEAIKQNAIKSVEKDRRNRIAPGARAAASSTGTQKKPPAPSTGGRPSNFTTAAKAKTEVMRKRVADRMRKNPNVTSTAGKSMSNPPTPKPRPDRPVEKKTVTVPTPKPRPTPKAPETKSAPTKSPSYDDMSFGKAFAAAKKQHGEGGNFTWRGKKYAIKTR